MKSSFESLDPFKTFEAPIATTSKHFQADRKDAATDDFQTFLAFEVSPPPVTSNGIEVTPQGFSSKSTSAFEGLDPFSVVQVKTSLLQEHQVSKKVVSTKPAITFEDDPFCNVEQSKTASKEVVVSKEFSKITSALAFEDFTGNLQGLEKSIGPSSQELGVRGEIVKANSVSTFEQLQSTLPAFGNPFSVQQNPSNFGGNDPFLTPVLPVPDSKETFRRSNAFEDSDPFEDLTKNGADSEIAFEVSNIRSSSPTYDHLTSTSKATPVPAFDEFYLAPQTPSSGSSFVSACEEFTSGLQTSSKESFLTDNYSTQPKASEPLQKSTDKSEEVYKAAAYELQPRAETSAGDWLRFSNDPFSNISSNSPAAESQLSSHQFPNSNPFMEHKNGVIESEKWTSADHVNDWTLDNTSKVPPVSLSTNIWEQVRFIVHSFLTNTMLRSSPMYTSAYTLATD